MIQFGELNALARRCKFLDSVPREEVTFSGPDGPIPELCHEMDSLGPAVSKLQGKTERRLPLYPAAANFSSFRSPPAPHRSPQCILLALVRSSTYLCLHRPNRPARGFTAPNIPRASDTLGPAMIHLCRGYRTARSAPFFLARPLPSAFYLLLNFFSPPLFFFTFIFPFFRPSPRTSPLYTLFRSFNRAPQPFFPSLCPIFSPLAYFKSPSTFFIADFFLSFSPFFLFRTESFVPLPPPFTILLSLSSATRDARCFYHRGKPAVRDKSVSGHRVWPRLLFSFNELGIKRT